MSEGLTLGSLFSGIGGLDAGFERAGFKTKWQVEIEPYCRKILARHFPDAKRFEDITQCFGPRADFEESRRDYLTEVDCVVAGVPCQDVSVAGARAGLHGKRTGLFFDFARLLRELRPTRFVFENVPGLLSSNNGRDFAEVQRVLMVECGYGISWRVLDSQFFGVAQRRRRLFIVGSFGRPCPSEILFEPDGGGRDSSAVGQAWPNIAVPLTSGSAKSKPARRLEDDFNLAIAPTITGEWAEQCYRGDGSENVVLGRNANGGHTRLLNAGEGADDAREAAVPRNPDIAYSLRSDPGGTDQGHNTTYAVTENMRNRSQGPGSYIANTLDSRSGGDDDNDNDARGNRLVGAPSHSDGMRDFAGLPKGMDSPRYRALGNAVTVSVAFWIAKRLAAQTCEA